MNDRERKRRAEHEALHVAAAKRYGASIAWANLNEVQPRGIPSAHAQLVFQLVGDHNPNSGLIRKILEEFPKAQRAGVLRKARAEARRIRPDRRVVEKLLRDGRL